MVGKEFQEKQDLLFYQFIAQAAIDDMINHYLQNAKEREIMISKGQEKVKNNHMWDQCVQLFLSRFTKILKKLEEFFKEKKDVCCY